MDTFIETLPSIFENNETHHGTKSCLHVMYSYSLYPLITKPSRISELRAMLLTTTTLSINDVCIGLLIMLIDQKEKFSNM